MSKMQVVCEKENFKKFMAICLETDVLPDETFESEGAYVLCFHGITWGGCGYENFTDAMKELMDELDGEDVEPYKMLRIGELLTDLEERANDCGALAYDGSFYIVRGFSRNGNHFSM